MNTSVIIPVYNETQTIREVAEAAMTHADRVIIVDDGSTDGSMDQLDGLDLDILSNPFNMGKGYSLQRGLKHGLESGADLLITLDGDLQHDPNEIPRLIMAAENHPARIIIAARLIERKNAPKLRSFANQFADFWVSWAAGYPVNDSQSGFRLYPSTVVEQVTLNTDKDKGFVFESEFLIEAAKLNFYSISVPVMSIYNPDGRDSHYRPWRDTWRIVNMIAGHLLRRWLYLPGLLRSIKLLRDPRDG